MPVPGFATACQGNWGELQPLRVENNEVLYLVRVETNHPLRPHLSDRLTRAASLHREGEAVSPLLLDEVTQAIRQSESVALLTLADDLTRAS